MNSNFSVEVLHNSSEFVENKTLSLLFFSDKEQADKKKNNNLFLNKIYFFWSIFTIFIS